MWCLQESNQGHKDFQSFALPTELRHPAKTLWVFERACGQVFYQIPQTRLQKYKFIQSCKILIKIYLRPHKRFYSPNFIGMNLVLDFGNTRIKMAFFEGARLLKENAFESVTELLASGCLNEKFEHGLLSSVTQDHLKVIKILNPGSKLNVFNSQTPIPLKNRYKTPETLGSDRLLASIASFTLFPNQNVLTIDVGTCIKYNFVNQNNEFLGGAISPGIPMRLKAMHNFTSALPLLEAEAMFNQLLGDDTKSSMLSGAQLGAAFEVDETINRYRDRHPDLKVVLAGGDGHYLSGQLKNPFFANPNGLLLGLNTVLLYNIEN